MSAPTQDWIAVAEIANGYYRAMYAGDEGMLRDLFDPRAPVVGNAMGNNLAMSLALGGEYDDAIDILRKVTNSPAATATNRNNLALVLGLMERYDDAAILLRRDLNREEVKNNLDFYRSLIPLNSRQRARRIFGVSTAN